MSTTYHRPAEIARLLDVSAQRVNHWRTRRDDVRSKIDRDGHLLVCVEDCRRALSSPRRPGRKPGRPKEQP